VQFSTPLREKSRTDKKLLAYHENSHQGAKTPRNTKGFIIKKSLVTCCLFFFSSSLLFFPSWCLGALVAKFSLWNLGVGRIY